MLTRPVPSRLAAAVFLAAISALVAITSPAKGQELTEQDVRDWAANMLDAARPEHFARDLKLVVVQRITWHPSPEVIEATKRLVANRPDHPDRNKIPMWERHLAGDYTETKYVVWHKGYDEFRANTTYDYGEDSWRDVVRVNKYAWDLSSGELSLYDPTALPPLQDVDTVRRKFQGVVANFVNPFLEVTMREKYGMRTPGPPEIRADGDIWILRYPDTSAESGRAVELTVANFDSVPVVVRYELIDPSLSAEIATVYRYEAFQGSPLGRPIPGVCRYLKKNGQQERQFQLLALEILDQNEFLVVTTPSATDHVSDVVRTLSESIKIADLRAEWHAIASPDGAINAYAGPDPDQASQRGWNWTFVMAVGIAGVVAGVLIHIRRTN